MSIEKVYYQSLPGAFAAREASMNRKTGAERDAFVDGYLQGVQYAKPDPDVHQCPSCGSVMVHMCGADNIRMGKDIMNSGKQYEPYLKCEFACRSCGEIFNAHLKLSKL
jgi:hypothetical protein